MSDFKIIKERFRDMLKLEKLPDGYRGEYFLDSDGNPYMSSQSPKHKLKKTVQKDIAEMLHVSVPTLSNNVNGKTSPSAATMAFFEKHYGIDTDYLTDESVKYMTKDEAKRAQMKELIEGSKGRDQICDAVGTILKFYGIEWNSKQSGPVMYQGVELSEHDMICLAYKVYSNIGDDLAFLANVKQPWPEEDC